MKKIPFAAIAVYAILIGIGFVYLYPVLDMVVKSLFSPAGSECIMEAADWRLMR